MRPLDRGPVPVIDGITKKVSDYKDWRQHLIDALGNYCSYCNMALNDSPQVEHVVPKRPQPGQPAGSMTDWNNMLLACGPCNRAKGNRPNSPETHYLPDYHNTHLAFEYSVIAHPRNPRRRACIPTVRSTHGVNTRKALNTIELCKLDALTSNDRATDLRWKYRYEAWTVAQLWKAEWEAWGKTEGQRFIELLVTAALAKGFFSIWYTMFATNPEVLNALITSFPGTHAASFDPANGYAPVVRHDGDL